MAFASTHTYLALCKRQDVSHICTYRTRSASTHTPIVLHMCNPRILPRVPANKAPRTSDRENCSRHTADSIGACTHWQSQVRGVLRRISLPRVLNKYSNAKLINLMSCRNDYKHKVVISNCYPPADALQLGGCDPSFARCVLSPSRATSDYLH